MRNFFLIILVVLTSLTSIAQTKVQPAVNHGSKLIVYIDSVKIDFDIYAKYIDPSWFTDGEKIKDIAPPDYGIRFKAKDPLLLSTLLKSPLLSLNDVCISQLSNADKNTFVLFMLDGKLLTDTIGVRIPKICIDKIDVSYTSGTAYFKYRLPDAILMTISTKPISIPRNIRIKGVAVN